METKTNENTIKITLDVGERTAELLELEAKDNRRSRKSQMELALEKHGERYEKRIES